MGCHIQHTMKVLWWKAVLVLIGCFCVVMFTVLWSTSCKPFSVVALYLNIKKVCVMWCILRNNFQQSHLWVGVQFFSPACSKATIIDCSIRSLSMKPRNSSLYTVRSGSWKVHRGVSRSGSLLVPPVFETWERAKDTMVELAWEMPLDRRFSVAAKRQWQKMWRKVVI